MSAFILRMMAVISRRCLEKVKLGLEDLRDTVDVGSGVISSSETEDLDWINNWKKYFSSFHNW